jgi:hypothetical protein
MKFIKDAIVKQGYFHYKKIRGFSSSYLLDLSYGTPSARGAAEFLDVNANKINVATYGISL